MSKRKTRTIATILFDIIFLIACVCFAYWLSNFLFVTVPVEHNSMEATIHDGDKVILYKRTKDYQYGDVVVFDGVEIGGKGATRLIKRIIGLEGDVISVDFDADEGVYYICRNGERLVEEYCSSEMYCGMDEVVVGEGKFFFCGDNRAVSADSRQGYMGEVSKIVGRVLVRYTPDNGKFDLSFVKRLDN